MVYRRFVTRAAACAFHLYRPFPDGLFLTAGDFRSYVANYRSVRGMDFTHDVHDWMGGYPYELTMATEVDALMQGLGMSHVQSMARRRRSIGLFGSGCDEYLYRRSS